MVELTEPLSLGSRWLPSAARLNCTALDLTALTEPLSLGSRWLPSGTAASPCMLGAGGSVRLEGGAPDGEGAAHETGAAGAASAVISADEEGASALGGWWLGAVKVRPVGRKPTWYRVRVS